MAQTLEQQRLSDVAWLLEDHADDPDGGMEMKDIFRDPGFYEIRFHLTLKSESDDATPKTLDAAIRVNMTSVRVDEIVRMDWQTERAPGPTDE